MGTLDNLTTGSNRHPGSAGVLLSPCGRRGLARGVSLLAGHSEVRNESMKWNASLYDEKHSFVFKYGEEVLALLNPQHGERILDVGFGTGHLTKLIAEAGAEVPVELLRG